MPPPTFRPWSPRQAYLLAPSPADWVPEDHLVHFLLDVVEQLDLSAIEERYRHKDPRGVKAYHPAMMVALLLYSYCRGVMSSRKIARATYEDVATRYLVAEQHPHFTRIADFRKAHLPELAGLFVQVLDLCRQAGLLKLGHVSLDGTKIQANASKHKAMSHERMEADVARLQTEIDALLEQARQVDEQEDERLGEGQDEVDIPAELQRREVRLERIREAKAALEREAAQAKAAELRRQAEENEARAADRQRTDKARRQAATRATNQRRKADELDSPSDDAGDDDEGGGPAGAELPTHSPRTTADGRPHAKAQRNFTDSDSRIMVDGQGAFAQAYNAQAVVNDEQIIVAATLSNQPPDAQYLVPTLMTAIAMAGEAPDKLTADSGYWSQANAEWCEEQGIDAYLATRRQRHGPHKEGPERSGSPARQAMKAKVSSPAGEAIYRRRKATVEPIFGQVKEARGVRRFLLRGLEQVRHEWSLVCLTHNLLKLFRAQLAGAGPA